MIKFSWKKINDKLDWNATSVLEYFFLIRKVKIPAYITRKTPVIVKRAAILPLIPGPCYILNIDSVLRRATTPNELYMYLELASKRNVFDYVMRGVKYLPSALVEKYKIQWIELNSMLEIKDKSIYFRYEQESKQNGNEI